MIILAGISAYNIRYANFITGIRPVIFNLTFLKYLQALLVIAPLWIIIFALAGLYNIRSARTIVKEVYRVTLA